MIIHVFNHQKDLSISTRCVKALVRSVIAFEKQKCDEVSIYFVDTVEICDLHDRFFNDPSTTDCISFPMDEDPFEAVDGGYRILGEVFVCPKTALDYAAIHNTDPYEETTLYVIHGLLHLMGYNDIEEDEITLMRQAEIRHLSHIKELKQTLYKT